MDKISEDGISELPSSPLGPRSSQGGKLKKPPPITPRRFNRFFSPRSHSSNGSRGSINTRSSKILRDVTRSVINRNIAQADTNGELEPGTGKATDENGFDFTRSRKRQRVEYQTFQDSSIPSSPVAACEQRRTRKVEDADWLCPTSPESAVSESQADNTSTCVLPVRPRRIEQTVGHTGAWRVLNRSLGVGRASTSRNGSRRPDHCTAWIDQTQHFYSGETDRKDFSGTALPFCSASCNTNSILAIGDEEGSIRLIDSSIDSHNDFTKDIVRFRPHGNAVMDLAFSSDDLRLATASGDQTARIIDARTQQCISMLTGHVSSVKQVAFQPSNDNIVATSSRDGSIILWDLRCKRRVISIHEPIPITSHSTPLSDPANWPQTDHLTDVCEPYRLIPAAHSSYGLLTPRSSANADYKLSTRQRDGEISITALTFLTQGGEHYLATACESNATLKLWDVRFTMQQHSRRRRGQIDRPVAVTAPPASHARLRPYGINALSLSSDGTRLYALCRDSSVYAYSTTQILASSSSPTDTSTRHSPSQTATGVAPLYALTNPSLRISSFYIRSSLRPVHTTGSELLAVGSRDGCAILFPTDERFLRRSAPSSSTTEAKEEEEGGAEMPVYIHGTALKHAHDASKEITSLTFTHGGELVTCGDDFQTRRWREDAKHARDVRRNRGLEGGRGGMGWACLDLVEGQEEESEESECE